MSNPTENADWLPDDTTICHCMDVSAREIRAAIAGGATSVTELQDQTYACTGCGTCRDDLLTLLREAKPDDPEAS